MVEGGTPNTLLRRGLTKKDLPIGAEILVDGYQAKDGTNRANGRDLTFPDGRKDRRVRRPMPSNHKDVSRGLNGFSRFKSV